ncbi:MAG: hypothetical protein U1E83_01505 [Methylotetracoccus sp.]
MRQAEPPGSEYALVDSKPRRIAHGGPRDISTLRANYWLYNTLAASHTTMMPTNPVRHPVHSTYA